MRHAETLVTLAAAAALLAACGVASPRRQPTEDPRPDPGQTEDGLYPGPCRVDVAGVGDLDLRHIDYEYDDDDRVVRQVRTYRDLTEVKERAYDEAGRLVAEALAYDGRPVARRVRTTYDEAGRVLTEETDGDGCTPDEARLRTCEAADRAVDAFVRYVYDDAGRVLVEERGLGPASGSAGTRIDNTWDEAGRLTATEVDRNGDHEADEVTRYAYDDAGNLVREDVDSPADGRLDRRTTYAYDEDGHRVLRELDRAADGTVDTQVRYRYDGEGRVVEELESAGERQLYRAVYAYDDLGNPTREQRFYGGGVMADEVRTWQYGCWE